MSLLKTFRMGQEYAKVWPRHAVVAAMTESRVVPAVKFAERWVPAVAILNFFVQWEWLGSQGLAQVVVTSLFLLSIPLQGWYWLGQRAQAPLDPKLHHWYRDLAVKLAVQPQAKPTHLMLAKLIRKALQELPPDQH